jgi:hypothetical protein
MERTTASRIYRRAQLQTQIIGLIVIIGWLWAAWLAFVPADADMGGPYPCAGSPAFYDRAKESQEPDLCEQQANDEIRLAVGVMMFIGPLSALWAYRGAQLPALRKAAVEESLISLGTPLAQPSGITP